MTGTSRRAFLLGGAAALIAGPALARAAMPAPTPLFAGEVGVLNGIRFPDCPYDDTIAAVRWAFDEIDGFVVQPIPAKDFYITHHPSHLRDLAA